MHHLTPHTLVAHTSRGVCVYARMRMHTCVYTCVCVCERGEESAKAATRSLCPSHMKDALHNLFFGEVPVVLSQVQGRVVSVQDGLWCSHPPSPQPCVVFACVCLFACVCVCMNVCVHACMHACVCVWMFVCGCVCVCVCVYARICECAACVSLRKNYILLAPCLECVFTNHNPPFLWA